MSNSLLTNYFTDAFVVLVSGVVLIVSVLVIFEGMVLVLMLIFCCG